MKHGSYAKRRVDLVVSKRVGSDQNLALRAFELQVTKLEQDLDIKTAELQAAADYRQVGQSANRQLLILLCTIQDSLSWQPAESLAL